MLVLLLFSYYQKHFNISVPKTTQKQSALIYVLCDALGDNQCIFAIELKMVFYITNYMLCGAIPFDHSVNMYVKYEMYDKKAEIKRQKFSVFTFSRKTERICEFLIYQVILFI